MYEVLSETKLKNKYQRHYRQFGIYLPSMNEVFFYDRQLLLSQAKIQLLLLEEKRNICKKKSLAE